jgi:hypothetical protein
MSFLTSASIRNSSRKPSNPIEPYFSLHLHVDDEHEEPLAPPINGIRLVESLQQRDSKSNPESRFPTDPNWNGESYMKAAVIRGECFIEMENISRFSTWKQKHAELEL